jgi:muramoyltetrapeptide carboxypeptidase LdcA involved in peptidoglycan recycling
MIGIDNQIEKLRSLFENNLWTASSSVFHGRCFRNERNDGLIPEVTIGGNDYKEVLLQDFQDGTIFFDVEPERTARVIGSSDITANVSIYFAINLDNLYSGLGRLEQTETAYKDAITIINKSAFVFQSFETGFSSYSVWTYDDAAKDNMQRYHLFRVDTTINYNLICKL